MTEPGGWTTPAGWGPPAGSSGSTPAPAGPAGSSYEQPYGQPYGQRPYGAPEVKPGVVPLRPLALGELLDGAVAVLRRYPRPALGFAALVAVVVAVVNALLLVTAFRPFFAVTDEELTAQDAAAIEAALGGAAAGGLLSGLLTLLSTAVLTGVLTAVVGRAVLGQPIGFGEAWVQLRPQLGKLVGIALLLAVVPALIAGAGLLVGVLVIALGGAVLALVGVPVILAAAAAAVYLYVRWSLAPCVLLLERTSATDSLRRSATLVGGDWWRVFGITLLTFVVALFVSLVIQVPFEFLGAGSFGELTSGVEALTARAVIASALGGIVAATLVDPFSAGVRALLYVDRRMRAEGLDVALTAAATSRS